jgi:hypothetical protein
LEANQAGVRIRAETAPRVVVAPRFKIVGEHGLNMIDASQLTYLTAKAETASAAGS